MTAGANGQWFGRQRGGRHFPIEQREDALPFGFGCGAEPAEVANAPEAFGEHMLEKAAQELLGGKLELMPLLVSAVSVFEGDAAISGVEDALGTHGCVINICGQIFDCGLPGAGRLDIDDPRPTPGGVRDHRKAGTFGQSGFESVPEAGGQHFLGQEEPIGRRSAPAQAIGTQAGSRDYAVDMRVKLQLPAPGVQDAQDA